jgi:hypothetical protein
MEAKTATVNIGPKEIRKRVLLGVVLVAGGVALAAIFSRAEVSGAWYAALFLPFWAGSLCLGQARKKT